MSNPTRVRNVRVPDTLWSAAAATAAERGEPLADVLRDCLATYVDAHVSARLVTVDGLTIDPASLVGSQAVAYRVTPTGRVKRVSDAGGVVTLTPAQLAKVTA
ncbi:hypothetical protein [Demequina subtropica]|uniref:hypothetical protein n=1 Tax=Demequina subtropica TaxID=1638989 RepID=UPI000785F7A0|nr:hypothetical protein [Demequina subtropica]